MRCGEACAGGRVQSKTGSNSNPCQAERQSQWKKAEQQCPLQLGHAQKLPFYCYFVATQNSCRSNGARSKNGHGRRDIRPLCVATRLGSSHKYPTRTPVSETAYAAHACPTDATIRKLLLPMSNPAIASDKCRCEPSAANGKQAAL